MNVITVTLAIPDFLAEASIDRQVANIQDRLGDEADPDRWVVIGARHDEIELFDV